MSFFDEMETLTPKKSRDLEGSCCLDEALNIKQMFRNYKQKKENAKVEAEKAKIENEKISKFTYDMEQNMTGNVDGSAIIKAIKEYETGNKRFALIRLSYAINFLGMAHPEDAEKAKSLVKSEIKRAREAGVEKSSILRELRLCKAAASKHTAFVNGLVDDITGKVSEAVELTLPGDGVKETTSEKEYVKVPTKQEVDMESKLEESVDSLLEDVYHAEDLLDEAMELFTLCEGKDIAKQREKLEKQIKKTERALKIAKMAREELENMTKTGMHVSFAQRGWGTGWGTGMSNNSTARSTARGKLRADEKIEKIEAKLADLKQKLAELGEEQVGGSVQMTDLESKLEESVSFLLEEVEDIDDLLDEAMELLTLSEGNPQRKVEKADKKVKKAERKLKMAKMAREELDRMDGEGSRHKSKEKQGFGTGLGTGMGRNSHARSIVRGKMRADDRIERAERKLQKAKEKADVARKNAGMVNESMELFDEEAVLIQFEESLDILFEEIDDIDDLLDEAMELDCLNEDKQERLLKKVKKAERKLKMAKMAREELDRMDGSNNRHESKEKQGFGTGLGTGMGRNSHARSIVRGKMRADNRIEKAERKLQKAKEKAGLAEAMQLTLPGDGVKEITSEKDVYGKVAAVQTVDAPEPKKDQVHEEVVKVGKADPSEVEEMVEDADEEEELMGESTVIEYFDEIKLSESQVRVFSQYGKYIISESDFEACCAYYDGESEETVLNAIAEANNIDANEIHIMLAEGRCAAKGKVKKAMNKKGSSAVDAERKRTEAKIRRLKDQLKDTAPSSATAKKLQAQIKKLKATLK